MVNKILISVIAIGFIFLIVCCKKNSNNCNQIAEPPVFFFQIKENGIVLDNSVLEGIKIYCLLKNDKKYISDLSPATDMYPGNAILKPRQIATFDQPVFLLSRQILILY